jgi:hypothetical protein
LAPILSCPGVAAFGSTPGFMLTPATARALEKNF